MWIFCCGMLRSGSTLHYQLASHLVEEAGLGRRIEWMDSECFPELIKRFSNYKGFKVIKTHNCTNRMAEEIKRGNGVGLYVYRDLRDVIISQMRKDSETFQQLWKNKLIENALYANHIWTNLPHVMISKYEIMINDLTKEVKRIANHLNIPSDLNKCKKIAECYTIENQKTRIEKFKKKLSNQQVKFQAFDPHTLLHSNHIYSGKIGGWKDVLSMMQVAMIEKKAGPWLVEKGYNLSNPHLNLLEKMRLKFVR